MVALIQIPVAPKGFSLLVGHYFRLYYNNTWNDLLYLANSIDKRVTFLLFNTVIVQMFLNPPLNDVTYQRTGYDARLRGDVFNDTLTMIILYLNDP